MFAHETSHSAARTAAAIAVHKDRLHCVYWGAQRHPGVLHLLQRLHLEPAGSNPRERHVHPCADIATRSLRCLVHVDAEEDDVVPHLGDAAERITLPDHFCELLDRASHVVVAGPLKNAQDEAALTPAADAGELLAAIAHVSFT